LVVLVPFLIGELTKYPIHVFQIFFDFVQVSFNNGNFCNALLDDPRSIVFPVLDSFVCADFLMSSVSKLVS
jgi:hypothetical protein